MGYLIQVYILHVCYCFTSHCVVSGLSQAPLRPRPVYFMASRYFCRYQRSACVLYDPTVVLTMFVLVYQPRPTDSRARGPDRDIFTLYRNQDTEFVLAPPCLSPVYFSHNVPNIAFFVLLDICARFIYVRVHLPLQSQVLTQLLLYYTRFQEIIRKSWRRPPAFSKDLVSTSAILKEIKTYSRSY